MPDTDRLEKHAILNAPLERVWSAIIDSASFGAWFGAEFDGPFVVGQTTSGRIVPTQVDPVVAASQEPHRGAPLSLEIVAIEPMSRFVFRWNGALESEVMTTVTFDLKPHADGVSLSIIEQGFDELGEPLGSSTRESNGAGWEAQLGLIAAYLAR